MTREEAIKILKSKMDGHTDASYDWAETVRMAIEALGLEPRWIPVSERLPEANIYDGHGPVWKHKVLITGYLSFDNKKETFITTAFAEDVRNKCVLDINVTAWMPLPEPYKAESEG